MTYLAITLAVGWAFSVLLFLRHLKTERDFMAAQLAESAAERQILLERIQRPERVPVETAQEPSPEALHIPYDDDEAYTEYVQSKNGTEK